MACHGLVLVLVLVLELVLELKHGDADTKINEGDLGPRLPLSRLRRQLPYGLRLRPQGSQVTGFWERFGFSGFDIETCFRQFIVWPATGFGVVSNTSMMRK